MRIILFDIDGTLISTRGAGQQAMRHVARETTGSAPDDRRLRFAGRTDRSIISDHFETYGIDDNADNFEAFRETFISRLPEKLAACDGMVLPGIHEALQRLSDHSNVRLGLLTGNLREAARLKLDHFGLSECFLHNGELIGGFGDHHHHRDDVARDALLELRERLDVDIEPSSIWVIGDTPHDVRCARAIGAYVLAVATGEFALSELEETEPDLLAENMLSANGWWERLTAIW